MTTILTLDGVFEDPRAAISLGEPAQPTVPACVSLEQFLAWQDACVGIHPDMGISLQPADEFEALLPRIGGVRLIAIEFPVFTDGRGYSTARLLRDRGGYRGQLRATGDILRDQLWFLHQVGFDAFELRADQDLDAAREAFSDYVVPQKWSGSMRTI